MATSVHCNKDFWGLASPPRRRQGGGRKPRAGDLYCAQDYLLIPGGRDRVEPDEVTASHDRYCGGSLAPGDTPAPVPSSAQRLLCSVLR